MPGPLHGLTVIELTGLGPGPLAATLLADLGAHVLRVDRPGAPVSGGELLGYGRALLHLDLRSPEGLARLRELAGQADVLIEGFRPGVAERLGLGPETLLALNPRLVYGRMTGWGQEGPRSQQAGHDINYLGLTGALHAIGTAESPVPPLNLVADFGGGTLFLVMGVLAALQARSTTGRGQVVDAAMVDGASYLMMMMYRFFGADLWHDRRASNTLDGGAPFYGVYGCADGRHMAVGPIEAQFYAQLLERLGLDPSELPEQNTEATWPELRARVEERFAAHNQAHWIEVFDGSDACVSPILTMAEAPHDEHLRARGTFVEGVHGWEPGVAPRFSATPATRADRSAETFAAFGLAPPD